MITNNFTYNINNLYMFILSTPWLSGAEDPGNSGHHPFSFSTTPDGEHGGGARRGHGRRGCWCVVERGQRAGHRRVAKIEIRGDLDRDQHDPEQQDEHGLSHGPDTGQKLGDHEDTPQREASVRASRTVQAPSAASLSNAAIYAGRQSG